MFNFNRKFKINTWRYRASAHLWTLYYLIYNYLIWIGWKLNNKIFTSDKTVLTYYIVMKPYNEIFFQHFSHKWSVSFIIPVELWEICVNHDVKWRDLMTRWLNTLLPKDHKSNHRNNFFSERSRRLSHSDKSSLLAKWTFPALRNIQAGLNADSSADHFSAAPPHSHGTY